MIEVAAIIKGLRDELSRREKELDAIMAGGQGTSNGSIPDGSRTPGKSNESTGAQRIQKFLEDNYPKTFEADDLAKHPSINMNIQVVRTTLSRLAIAKAIEKVTRGHYQGKPAQEPSNSEEQESPPDSAPSGDWEGPADDTTSAEEAPEDDKFPF